MRRLLAPLAIALSALFAIGPVAMNTASASTVTLPTVTGGYGTTPKITFPSSSAPSGLEVKVLSAGHGSTVTKGELLVVNYVGQIWGGKVFDSSFSRNETFGTPIGVGAVVKGWDQGLVGHQVGSRVLLSIPPSLGYGKTGNTGAGITSTDTLVFVIDLVAVYSKTVGDNDHANVVANSGGGVTVTNLLTTAPTVKIATGAIKPTAENVKLLAKGTGAKTTAGMLVLQYVANDWTNAAVASTWKTGSPDGEYVGVKSTPSAFDPLVGDPIGSRVLIELPANTNGGPYALAVQIAAEVPAKASKP